MEAILLMGPLKLVDLPEVIFCLASDLFFS